MLNAVAEAADVANALAKEAEQQIGNRPDGSTEGAPPAPSKPTEAQVGDNFIHLTWSMPSDAGDGPFIFELSYGKKYVGTWRSVPCSPTEEGFGAMKEWTTPLDGLEPGEKYLSCAPIFSPGFSLSIVATLDLLGHHHRPSKDAFDNTCPELKMFGRELQACGRGIRRRAWSPRRRPARGASGQTGARRLRRRGRGRASPTPARPWAVSNTVQTNPQLIVELV